MRLLLKYITSFFLSLIPVTPSAFADEIQTYTDDTDNLQNRLVIQMPIIDIIDIDSLLKLAADVIINENPETFTYEERDDCVFYVIDRFPCCSDYFSIFFLYFQTDNCLKDIKIDDSQFDVELYPQTKRPNFDSLHILRSTCHWTKK